MPTSDIPFGSEFSPSVIDLAGLLRLVKQHDGDRAALQSAIDSKYFSHQKTDASTGKTLGDNTVLSMQQYGLLQLDRRNRRWFALTDLGRELVGLSTTDASKVMDVFAKHVMSNCKGLLLASVLEDIAAAQEPLNKQSVIRRLRERGLHYPENGKHLNVLRQWLEQFGVVNPEKRAGGGDLWRVDPVRIAELTGTTTENAGLLAGLRKDQADFARALALFGTSDWIVASKVRDHAVALYGTHFQEGGLPQSVLHRLEECGLLEQRKTTGGRGAKSHEVKATQLLKTGILDTLVSDSGYIGDKTFRRLSRLRLDEILETLTSTDKHQKGIALEALAFFLSRILDLQFVKWRLRSRQTGGAEVDVLVESARLLFSRWQVQCKNTSVVTLEDVAKEVGVAVATRANVILLATTGKVAETAKSFADQVMSNTAMQIVFIHDTDLKAIVRDPGAVTMIIQNQSKKAMLTKRQQLEDA